MAGSVDQRHYVGHKCDHHRGQSEKRRQTATERLDRLGMFDIVNRLRYRNRRITRQRVRPHCRHARKCHRNHPDRPTRVDKTTRRNLAAFCCQRWRGYPEYYRYCHSEWSELRLDRRTTHGGDWQCKHAAYHRGASLGCTNGRSSRSQSSARQNTHATIFMGYQQVTILQED